MDRHRRREGALWIEVHADDARARDLVDGELVRVNSERGELQAVCRDLGPRAPRHRLDAFRRPSRRERSAALRQYAHRRGADATGGRPVSRESGVYDGVGVGSDRTGACRSRLTRAARVRLSAYPNTPTSSLTNFAATYAVRSRKSFAGCTRRCRRRPPGRGRRQAPRAPLAPSALPARDVRCPGPASAPARRCRARCRAGRPPRRPPRGRLARSWAGYTSAPNRAACARKCAGQRPHADLDQPSGQSLFHHARERARMRVAIALEGVVQVAVRVEVQYRRRRNAPGPRSENRIGDGVIAAEHQGAAAVVQERRDAGGDALPGRGAVLREHEIARIIEHVTSGDVVAGLVPGVARSGPQRRSNGVGGGGGATEKRRRAVPRHA